MSAVGRLRLSAVLLLSVAAFALGALSFAGELIEPTRTLQGGVQRWGSLTVFSEPPEVEVYLDGEKVGKTPLWLERVKAGFHGLKVEGEEAEIYVDEGKPVKIGLFEGSFVRFPKEEEKEPPVAEKKTPTPPPRAQQPAEEERRARDRIMWEMLISGPLRR